MIERGTMRNQPWVFNDDDRWMMMDDRIVSVNVVDDKILSGRWWKMG